jgi:ribosome-binding protein aMBF1 (putative translation factor)
VKAHRQYVKEQIKRDSRFAKELAQANVEVRLAVMIAKLREKRGWSQRKLAEVTGIKQPQIARIEMGRQTPTLETLWKLADALGAEVVIGPRQHLEMRAA